MKTLDIARRLAAAVALICTAGQPLLAETFAERVAPLLRERGIGALAASS